MNSELFLSKNSINTIETLEELSQKSEISLEEYTITEYRIVKWLKNNGFSQGIPEEKEYQYFEEKRVKALKTTINRIKLESPLLMRRRTSLEEGLSPEKGSIILKLSKFQTQRCFCEPNVL